MLRKGWLSLLAQRKTLLVKKAGQLVEATLVCGASHYGAVGLKVTLKNIGGHKVVLLDEEPGTIRLASNLRLDDWYGFSLKFMPPAYASKLVKDAFAPEGLIAFVNAASPAESSLVKFSGWHGFRGHSVARLKDLITELGVAVDRVSALNEVQAVTVLLEQLFAGHLKAEMIEEDVAEAEQDIKRMPASRLHLLARAHRMGHRPRPALPSPLAAGGQEGAGQAEAARHPFRRCEC